MTATRFENLTLEKETGSVYTPIGMANDLSDSVLSNLETHDSVSILEPAAGDGRLLRSLLERLAPAVKTSVVAYELNSEVLQETSERLTKEFPQVSFSFVNKDIIEDFLIGQFMGQQFDVVIANPPYLRTQIMGADKSKRLAKLFQLRGRFDIYYVFIMMAHELLSDRGVAGFVTSNRFMKVKSGQVLRTFLLNKSQLIEIIDYGDTKPFEAAVLPCTFVFKRGKTTTANVKAYSIYNSGESSDSSVTAVFPYDKIRTASKINFKGASFTVQSGNLLVSETDGTWSVGSEESTAWLETVDAHTNLRLGDLGKIRVGIKTTADKIFILKDPSEFGNELPELARPLITHRNAGQIVGRKNPRWMVVYPHESHEGKRRVIPLEDYPKTKAYLNAHRSQLEARKYVKKAGRQWYEVWVPQDPSKWSQPKIVFRDIADSPQFWLETSGAIINGDCYWLDGLNSVSETSLYLALGVLNSSFITEYYDRRVNNKLYAGKRRFMTQYVEQFPLPNPDTIPAKEIVQLVGNAIERHSELNSEEKVRVNALVYSCFGLESKKSGGSGS